MSGRQPMIRISIAESGAPSRLVTFNQDVVTIGRSPECDLRLTGQGVSGAHCRVRRDEAGLVIEDLGSTNGTYLNRQRLGQPASVGGSDEVVMAIYTIRILDGNAVSTSVPAVQPVTAAPPAPSSVTTASPASGPSQPTVTRTGPSPPTATPTGPVAPTVTPSGPSQPTVSASAPVQPPTTQLPAGGDRVWAREWEKIDLLTRAWIASGRSRAKLLRGEKLKHARQWLAKGRRQATRPKREHRDFIVAGARAAQVRILGRVTIGGLVLGAGVAAAVQVSRHEELSDFKPQITRGQLPTVAAPVDAEGMRRAADAAGAAAESVLESDPALAVLLAAEGLSRLPVEEGAAPRGTRSERVFRRAMAKLRSRPLLGHEGPVRSVALAPNGKWAVTGSGDQSRGSAYLWELREDGALKPTALRGHTRPVHAMAITADGKYLFTAADELTIYRWDLEDRTPGSTSATLLGHRGSVTSLDVSGDGRWLATASVTGEVFVWDATAAKAKPSELRGHEQRINAVDINHDGTIVAAVSDDLMGSIWQVNAGSPVRRAKLEGHEGAVLDVAIAPDNSWVLTASQDGTGRLWRADKRAPSASSLPLLAHEGPLTAVAITPDSKLGVTAGEDDKLVIWELSAKETERSGVKFDVHKGDVTALTALGRSPTEGSSGKAQAVSVSAGQDAIVAACNLDDRASHQDCVAMAGHKGPVLAVAASADRRWVISGGEDRTARIWDHRSQRSGGASRVARGHDAQVLSVALSNGDTRMLTASADGTVRRWDLTRPGRIDAVTTFTKHKGRVSAVAVSPDGALAASAGEDGVVRVWDLSVQDPSKGGAHLAGHKRGVNRLEFSRDSKLLVSASTDGTARVWKMSGDLKSGVKVLKHGDEINFLSVGPTSDYVMTGSPTRVKLWNLSAAPQPRTLHGHEQDVLAVEMGPKGRWAASSGLDKVILWDLHADATGRRLARHEEGADALAFSPDGNVLASGSRDKTIRLWDLESKRPEDRSRVLTGHEKGIRVLAFTPDGRYLLSGSNDSTVRVWDLEAGDGAAISKSAVVLDGHGQLVADLALSADGAFAVTASYDATARIWPLDPNALIPLGCHRVGRSATPQEWRQHFPDTPYRSICGE